MRISDWSSDVCSSDLPALRIDSLPQTSPKSELIHKSGGKQMVTVTARKHIIAAIRRATLCSQRTAMNIVDANWYRVHSFDADMRLAEITINLTNPDDFSGQLRLWDTQTWKTKLEVPAGGLRAWATSSIEVAYAERQKPSLPRRSKESRVGNE